MKELTIQTNTLSVGIFCTMALIILVVVGVGAYQLGSYRTAVNSLEKDVREIRDQAEKRDKLQDMYLQDMRERLQKMQGTLEAAQR